MARVAGGIAAGLALGVALGPAPAARAGAVDLGDFAIPGSRVPTWYIAPEGGIPDTSSWTVYDVSDAADMTPLACGTVDLAANAGATDIEAINCAIAAVPAQSILFVPPGRVDLPDRESITFGAGDGEKVLRCASNSRSRIVMADGALEGDKFSPCWGSRDAFVGICSETDPGIPVPWTGGHTEGSSIVTVFDATGFAVGDWIFLEQDDDDAALACGIPGTQNKDDNWNSVHKIAAKIGNDLTLERPLRRDYTNTNQTVSPFTALEYVGIENCGFELTTVVNKKRTAAIFPVNAANAWITGNRFSRFPEMAIVVKDAARILIQGNVFEDSIRDGSGPQQVFVFEGATDTVIENNVFDDADPLKIERGANGTVVAYNYWTAGDTRGPFLHGMATETLIEGNHSDMRFSADNFWCSQGPRNTLFRNRFLTQEARCWRLGDDWDDEPLCATHADCTAPQLCYDAESSGIISHGDKGHGNQIAPFLNVIANAASHVVGRPACGSNAVTENTCKSFDASLATPNLWLERNRTRGVTRLDEDAPSTTEIENREFDPAKAPAAWQPFSGPDSLYRASAPDWWCQEACGFDLNNGIGAFGDDLTRPNQGQLCKLPAQIRHEGGICTPLDLPTP